MGRCRSSSTSATPLLGTAISLLYSWPPNTLGSITGAARDHLSGRAFLSPPFGESPKPTTALLKSVLAILHRVQLCSRSLQSYHLPPFTECLPLPDPNRSFYHLVLFPCLGGICLVMGGHQRFLHGGDHKCPLQHFYEM